MEEELKQVQEIYPDSKEIDIHEWYDDEQDTRILPLNTEDELLKAIKIIDEETLDEESCHMFLDQALLIFIGNEKITEAFRKVDKWYS